MQNLGGSIIKAKVEKLKEDIGMFFKEATKTIILEGWYFFRRSYVLIILNILFIWILRIMPNEQLSINQEIVRNIALAYISGLVFYIVTTYISD